MEPSDSLKGHPSLAEPNNSTERLSSPLEKILRPLLLKLKSYIKEDLDFLKE